MDSLLVQNQKIEVEWHFRGHSDNPTLVFLHEGLGCVSLWKDVPAQLSKMTHCNAFVFSRLGHGSSDPCPDLSYSVYPVIKLIPPHKRNQPITTPLKESYG